ncbi:MAG TPA: ABC transporter permease [Longimicrobiaceae bacterium]|nr:ABC transporter permease [Longimicrobiaceae bacterium]
MSESLSAIPVPPGLATASAEPRRSVLSDWAEIARDLSQYRYLLLQLALRDVRVRYKQAVMGVAWAVFMPSMIVLAGLAVRLAMAVLSHRAVEGTEVAALAVKSVPWAFFVGTLQFATSSLTGNVSLVTKVYFPREVLPLAATLAQVWDAAIAGAALVLVLPFLGVAPHWSALWALPLLVLLLAFTCAASLAVSCANLFFRDVKYIVQVLLTFGIFFTPVFFEPRMFGAAGARLLSLNPLTSLLEGLRLSVVDGHNLLTPLVQGGVAVWEPWWLAYGAAWAVAGLAVSSILFHRMQILFAEYA